MRSGESSAPDHRLGRCRRLTDSRDFQRIYRSGKSEHGRHLVVFWMPREDAPGSRVGVVVSKKHGNAVRRTRIKRRLRELFRRYRDVLRFPCDMILIPRARSRDVPFEDWVEDFRALAEKINRANDGAE